jgi:hypothetical protein
MKSIRRMVAALVVLGLSTAAFLAQPEPSATTRMIESAQSFLDALSDEQRKEATFAFDDKERLRWFFVPMQDAQRKSTRKGVPFERLTADQKKAALSLVRSGTSESGFRQATTIMSLEAILHDLERNGSMVRNPNWYFVSVFGKPAKVGKWGWRVEGHHLSLNYTVSDGKVIAATPAFFGANPAMVKDGPRKGLRTLDDVDDLARKLVAELDPKLSKVVIQAKQFPEIEQIPAAKIGAPLGVSADQLNDSQFELLKKLLKTYTQRLPGEIGAAQWAEVEKADRSKIYFAFAGEAEVGKPHSYQIQGPTFLVQFLNVQADSAKNPANHIHSVWRDLPADFGVARK